MFGLLSLCGSFMKLICSSIANEGTMDHRFCVVFHATSTDFRLMETNAGEPAVWHMQMNLNGVLTNIEVRDLIRPENDIPLHVGLQMAITTSAPNIDASVEAAGRVGETVISLLCTSSRAYAPEIQPFVAYEVTQDIAERPFIQWFPMPPLLSAKTAVPATAFARLFELLPATDERTAQRVRLSLDWHRVALRETEPLFRFVHLWIALESIGNLVAEYYTLDTSGWQGLRRLAKEEGYEESIISEILGIRSHIFHGVLRGKRLLPTAIRLSADELIPTMEHILLAGWLRLLNSYDTLPDFPRIASTRHPMRHIVHGTLLNEDSSQWGNGVHPHFAGQVDLSRKPTSDPNTVTVSYTLNAQPRHFNQWRGGEFELWGPRGPNTPKIEHSVNVTREVGDTAG